MIEITPLASSSAGNCIFVSDGVTNLLFDAGIKGKKLRELLFNSSLKLSDLNACLCTHNHQDHSKGLADLSAAGIDCYLLRSTREKLGLSGHRFHDIEYRKQFQIGSFNIVPFFLDHSDTDGTPVPNCGFLVQSGTEKVVYITDTKFCRYKFPGLTHIIIECNYDLTVLQRNVDEGLDIEQKKRLLESHFGLENVLEFLRVNDVSKLREIHLVHLSDRNSDEKKMKREVAALTGVPVYVTKK